MILNNSDYNNPRRLIRRIEILSFLINNPALPNNHLQPNFHAKFIGLKYKNRQDLVNAIKTRVEKRLQQGAINEVKKILQQGYTENDPGLKTIGYQQIIQYLKGNISLKQAIDQWINKEVQYAKRQLTYLKKYFSIEWIQL
jgi:tRNA dimethylallyltransferase